MLQKKIKKSIFLTALKASTPIFMGYITIGIAFGLLLRQAGYPPYLALVMSVFMYAGSAQYIAVGIFAGGSPLWEAVFIQLAVNSRHIAYSIALLKKYNSCGFYKPYLIFALTDETFALVSSTNFESEEFSKKNEQTLFIFFVSLLNHLYWITGSVIGAVMGGFIPFKINGIDFALTALFIVLMIEQMYVIKKKTPFIISGAVAVLCVIFAPERLSLLSALTISLAAVHLICGGSSYRVMADKAKRGRDGS
ncbi:MAG: AzlC family ABC transporter permease [Spirochaetaceae bacterium]|jgi:4-azaleucine resistance transporter AzlC|nr:AzlC family ABC transporter permease [Spirochaetaceae bacterium]